MILCHLIGEGPTSNYDLWEDIVASEGPISFDGVYENVYEHRHLLRGLNRKIYLFITGSYVGLDNSFDVGQPLEKFASWEQLLEMGDMGFELGWHTWTHPNLVHTTKDWDDPDWTILGFEITPPFPMDHFAYPYGRWNDSIASVVREHFKFGWSTNRGDPLNRFALPRHHVPSGLDRMLKAEKEGWVSGSAEDFLATSEPLPEAVPDLQSIELTPSSETPPHKTCTCRSGTGSCQCGGRCQEGQAE